MEIEIKNVSYKTIFNNINVKIEPGKINCLVGKNGSGKTALLNLLYCVDLNFSGEIYLNKIEVSCKTKGEIVKKVRKDISYLRQDYISDLFNVNILEDIKCSIENYDSIKLIELLKQFSLNENVLKKMYCDLSHGEIKKILIIKTLLKDSKTILLDEPTNGLDSKSISNLVKLLKKEKHNNKTIIVTSSKSDFLLKIADDFIVLNKREVRTSNDKYKLFSNDSLLNEINVEMPEIIKFKLQSLKQKEAKLFYRDNTNDLIKDIYRSINER